MSEFTNNSENSIASLTNYLHGLIVNENGLELLIKVSG